MSNEDIAEIAERINRAYEQGTPLSVAPSSQPGFDLDAAYAVETRLRQFREARGHKAAGRKVGFANKAVWRIFKLDTLVWAHMYDDTMHNAENNSATLRLPRARSLKIEPEIVFGMKEQIGPGDFDATAALAAVDWIAMGFEIIDCPFPDWKFEPIDFVASFGLHAALVIGERLAVGPDNVETLAEQLRHFKVRMLKNGELIEEGAGRNSLKSPALCLAELSNAISKRFPDDPLRGGEVVSSGTLTGGHPLEKGDLWRAELEGIPLPSLNLRFE